MNASQLKEKVLAAREDSLFFSRNNMKFAGDTMKNFGVSGPLDALNMDGKPVKVYQLYRRHATGKRFGAGVCAHFYADTFHQAHAITFPQEK